MDSALEEKVGRLRDEIHALRYGAYKGRLTPHKPLMFLAVIHLMEKRGNPREQDSVP